MQTFEYELRYIQMIVLFDIFLKTIPFKFKVRSIFLLQSLNKY